ncbi:hypothetical protein [Kitasatospora sp. NPDC002965]
MFNLYRYSHDMLLNAFERQGGEATAPDAQGASGAARTDTAWD